MKVPFFNMTAKDIATSKAMFGCIILIAVGAYLIYKGQFELGATVIGNAVGIMGLRDAASK